MAKKAVVFHGFVHEDPCLVADIEIRGKRKLMWVDETTENGETRYYIRVLGKDGEQRYTFFTLNNKGGAKFPVHQTINTFDFDPEGVFEEHMMVG